MRPGLRSRPDGVLWGQCRGQAFKKAPPHHVSLREWSSSPMRDVWYGPAPAFGPWVLRSWPDKVGVVPGRPNASDRWSLTSAETAQAPKKIIKATVRAITTENVMGTGNRRGFVRTGPPLPPGRPCCCRSPGRPTCLGTPWAGSRRLRW